MKLDFDLLDKMVAAGASARMVVDMLKEKSAEGSAAKATAAFLQFRAAYPKRDGANPWRPAELKFYTLVKSGVDPAEIIAGAIKLAQDEQARGNIGTRFIPQAITWLNQHRFKDTNAPAPQPAIDWEAILTAYKKLNHWSRWAGPDPSSPACRCPKELLIKHGIAA